MIKVCQNLSRISSVICSTTGQFENGRGWGRFGGVGLLFLEAVIIQKTSIVMPSRVGVTPEAISDFLTMTSCIASDAGLYLAALKINSKASGTSFAHGAMVLYRLPKKKKGK